MPFFTSSSESAPRYNRLLLGLLCITLITLLPPLLLLWQSGELTPISTLAQQQQSGKIKLLGLATQPQRFAYKISQYRQRQPDVLVIGSSRVMQIRQRFFTARMHNAGGAINNMQDGFVYLRKALAIQPPKIVLIGLDFWWFNEQAPHKPSTDTSAPPPLQQLNLQRLFTPYTWLVEHKISPARFIRIASGLDNTANRGIQGMVLGDGFAADGSYYYTGTITGLKPATDVRFADTLMRIEQGNRRFEYGQKVSQPALIWLLKSIRLLQQRHIPVLLFSPPLAPTVFQAMRQQANHYRYVQAWDTALHQLHIPYRNYLSAQRSLQADDCMFIDGFHGGDTVYARLLLDLGQHFSVLRRYINQPALHDISQLGQGHAWIADARISRRKEVDFLQLGCSKNAQQKLKN